MKAHFKKKFQLTDEGAASLVKSTSMSFLVYVINMCPVILLMLLINHLIYDVNYSKGVYVGASLGVLVLLFIGLFVEYEWLFNVTYKESERLRVRIAKTLKSLPLSYFSKKDLSDLSQSIMSDVESIEHAISHAIPKIYGLYFFLPIIGLLLIVGNVPLGLAVIVPTLLRFLVLMLFKDKILSGSTLYHGILRTNSEKFQETIELYQEIRGFQLGEGIKKDLYEQMDYSERMHLKTEKAIVGVLSLSALFSFISLGVVLVIGTYLVLNGELTLLYLLGYLLAAMKIKDMVDLSNETLIEVLYIAPRVEKIKEINEAKQQEGEDVLLKRFDLDLVDVGFSYDKEIPILNDVTFSAKQGEVTALVGPSGCGKTTLLRLLSRLYDYDKGKIMIDGHDLKDISTASLFNHISIVFQDVILFNTSILENIRIGRLDASDEEVKEAARLASCLDFIEKMPEGFSTKIGENGAELSGGERQRLSIARAFLKNAPILLLDEIASSLDVENERSIQESLNTLIKDKTVIIISHRLKSIENVDKIIVFDKGRVENIGTHESLLENSPLYQTLITKSQYAESFTY